MRERVVQLFDGSVGESLVGLILLGGEGVGGEV